MDVVEHLVPRTGEAELSAQLLIVVLLIDTARGQYGRRQVIRMVGIAIEPGVVLQHHGIGHGTIGLGHVRTFPDLVLTGSCKIVDRSQCAQLKGAEGLPSQVSLELQADFVQIDIEIVELVLDIERSVVAGVVLVGIKRARRVEGIAEGVDIEITAQLTIDLVDRTAQRARFALLAVVTTADEVQRELF